jgi:hypothetical protein
LGAGLCADLRAAFFSLTNCAFMLSTRASFTKKVLYSLPARDATEVGKRHVAVLPI